MAIGIAVLSVQPLEVIVDSSRPPSHLLVRSTGKFTNPRERNNFAKILSDLAAEDSRGRCGDGEPW
jgi:hypothetical protein